MKKCVFCWALALCLVICTAALANEWGAPGGTVTLFENTAYEDYTVVTDDYSRQEDTARLIVKNRYHQQLWWVEKADGEWQIVQKSTTAVYQPENEKIGGGWPKLIRDDGGFGLMYENESYWFDSGMILRRARYQGEDGIIMLTYDGERGYMAEDDGGSAFWDVYGGLKLSEFNISLMPRSVPDAVKLKLMSSMLHQVFSAPVAVMDTDRSKQNVYTAPTKKAFRAAKGKAAVNLKSTDGLTLLGRWNGWDVVEYEVSTRTSRIGYIDGGHIDDGYNWDEEFNTIPAVAREDTYITDDPRVSQFVTAELARGMDVTMLGNFGPFYAYVETTIDGKPARGFVPMRALELHPDTAEMAAKHILGGPYDIWAGGDMIPSNITFNKDGTYRAPYDEGVSEGTWLVRLYDPEEQLFWNNPPCVLEMTDAATGYVRLRGLTPMKEGFGLTNEEGGGGYRKR